MLRGVCRLPSCPTSPSEECSQHGNGSSPGAALTSCAPLQRDAHSPLQDAGAPPARSDLPVCALRSQQLLRLPAVCLREVIYHDSHSLHQENAWQKELLSGEGTICFLLLLSWGCISPRAFPAHRQSGVSNSKENVCIAMVHFNLVFCLVIFYNDLSSEEVCCYCLEQRGDQRSVYLQF